MKNKPIRVFALPSHQSEERTSGVDFVRIIQPMEHLAKEPSFNVTIWKTTGDTATMEWPEIAKNFDIIYFNYLNHAYGFAAMGAMARKYGTKLVCDLDDALWILKPDNAAFSIFQPHGEGIKTVTAIFNEVDYMTTTNPYLKNVITHYTKKRHDQIQVFPNCIDFDFYSYRAPFKDTKEITIMHFGSASHFVDLSYAAFVKAIDRLMQEYPNLTFLTVGSFFSNFKMKWGQRYRQDFGDVDVYTWVKEKYPQFMDQADIVVAPLVPDTYNKAKSDIKRSETAAGMKPFVGQRIRQYEEVIADGIDGMLCGSEDEWYNKLKQLIDSPSLRKSMAEKAFARVKKERNITDQMQHYKDFFQRVLDK